MGRLDIRLLGPPEITCEGELLHFPTRKALALLIYLVAEGTRGRERHNREKLIDLLWPDSDLPRGQASLRNALLRLRRALGTAADYLVIDDAWLSFSGSGDVFLDIETLVEAQQSADSSSLQAAAALYRADFLEGFSLPDAPDFDAWATIQRQHYHRLMGKLLARLSHLQAEEGNLQDALSLTLQWTRHDPLDETAYRRLMELYWTAGDKTAALQAYERCCTLLAEELGLQPSPETETLTERIKTSLPLNMAIHHPVTSDVQHRPPRHLVIPSPLHPITPSPPHLVIPFVGRSVKHLQLVTAFHATQQEGARVFVIEGESGIGKSRLATEFLQWAAGRGADVLIGRALEVGGRVPYQPLVDALRPRVERENAPEDWLGDVWLAELARLLPELRERYPDLPPAPDESVARARLLEAFSRLGEALARRRKPVVLFIDDLQWADAATLDTLRYTGRAWAANRTPILLLFVARSENLANHSTLATWLSDFARDLPLQQIGLGALTAEETIQLAQTLVADNKTAAVLARWLFAETAGHPFLMAELLGELTTQEVWQWQTNADGRWQLDATGVDSWLAQQQGRPFIPAGIRHFVQSRLQRLPSEAMQLLAAAAVIGRAIPFHTLCQVAGLDQVTVLPILEQLLAGRLIEEETSPLGTAIRLTHDQIREVVYTNLSATRRDWFHHRALQALESIVAPPAELAHHALAAHLPERAFHYHVVAGDAALWLFAWHEAITLFEQARTLQPQLDLPAADRQHLYQQLGRAYELSGDLEQAAAVYEELRQVGQQARLPGVVCAALNRLALIHIHLYNFATALRYLEEARGIAEDAGDTAMLAETEWNLAEFYHHQFDFRQSLLHSQQTLSLARELGDEKLIGNSLNVLAYAHLLSAEVETGISLMEEARAQFAKNGNRALEADCLTALAAGHNWIGRIEKGIAAAHAAEAICAAIHNPWGLIYSRVWLAAGLLDNGEYQAALSVAQDGQAEAERHHLPPMQIFIALILGKVYRTVGQLEAAHQTHLAAHRLNEVVASRSFAELIAAELCADYALQEKWEDAAEFARLALSLRRYESLPLVTPARWPETAALLRRGDVTAPGEDVQRWGELTGHLPRFQVPHLHSLAVLAEWEGQTSQALVYLEAARSLADRIGLRSEPRPIILPM